MGSSQQALQTNRFFFFKFIFELLVKNQRIVKQIVRREYLSKVQCIAYQLIYLDELYKLMESFFLHFFFRIIGQKPKNIQIFASRVYRS